MSTSSTVAQRAAFTMVTALALTASLPDTAHAQRVDSPTVAPVQLPAVRIRLGDVSRTEVQEQIARDGLRRELIGCYALFGEDQRPVDSGSYYNASPIVRLDSLPVEATVRDDRPGIVRVLHRLNARRRAQAASSPIELSGPAWAADSLTDSIRLWFSNGFSGAAFILAAPSSRADTLEGRAEEHWDFGPPFERPRGRARAIRVRCAS